MNIRAGVACRAFKAPPRYPRMGNTWEIGRADGNNPYAGAVQLEGNVVGLVRWALSIGSWLFRRCLGCGGRRKLLRVWLTVPIIDGGLPVREVFSYRGWLCAGCMRDYYQDGSGV